MSPVEFTTLAAPAHRCGSRCTDEVGTETLVNGIIYIDAIIFPIFGNVMLFPCFTPCTFCNVSLKCRFGAKRSEVHLSGIIWFPFTVCLIGHGSQFITVCECICRHAGTPLISIGSHSGKDCVFSGFTA